MLRYHRRHRAIAICLAGLAGYVDAVGFLQLGGFFVSFMSGNSTRLAVGIAERAHSGVVALGLVAGFVAGVVLGTLVGRRAPPEYRGCIVLAAVALLLTIAAAIEPFAGVPATIGAMLLAMGAENAVFERDGEVSIGLTYMTGTLVKIGQRIATALSGGDPLGWLPYFLLWAGLVVGATLGALAFPRLGLASLWVAAAAAAIMSMLMLQVSRKHA